MPGGPLNLISTNLPRPWSPRESTRDLMISSQKLWPLDHEAGQTRNITTLKRSNGTRTWYHSWSVNAIHIAYSECVSVAVGIQHAMRMRHIVICGLSGSIISVHIVLQTAWFLGEKKGYWTIKLCFYFLYKFFSKIPHSKKNPARCCNESLLLHRAFRYDHFKLLALELFFFNFSAPCI